MSIRLADAMPAMLQGWQNDLDAAWKLILGGVELGFTDIDDQGQEGRTVCTTGPGPVSVHGILDRPRLRLRQLLLLARL